MTTTTHLFNPRYRGKQREFCGPTAIAAVTGASLEDIRDAIRQERGPERKSDGSHMPIMGLTVVELLGVMDHLGWKVIEEDSYKDRAELKRAKLCTLGEFAIAHGHDGPFIVNVTGHYVAISHDEFCDTRSIMCTDLDRAMKWKGVAGKWVKNWWKFAQF